MRSAGFPRETREWFGSPGIRAFGSSPDSRFVDFELNLPKVSGLVREYSRFAETIGGGWFDHDCRPTAASDFRADKVRASAYQSAMGF